MSTREGQMQLQVLIVEDEQLVAMLVEDMLEDLGYKVSAVAANLRAGLQAAEQVQPDLAVLDVNLAGEKSFPIAEALLKKGVPFVFASGYGVSGVRETYPSAPVIQKPFTQAALADALEQAKLGVTG